MLERQRVFRPRGESRKVDLNRTIDRFLASPSFSDATRRAYRSDLNEFADFLARKAATLEEVDGRLLALYASGLGAARPGRQPSRLSERTIARKLAAVRGLLGFALGPARVPELALKPRRSLHLPETPRESEVDELLQASEGKGPLALRNRTLLELVYSAGLRSAEAVGLDLADVDFENETIHVRGKGGKERVVPLGEQAAAWSGVFLAGGSQSAPAQTAASSAWKDRMEHAAPPRPSPASPAPRLRHTPARGWRRSKGDPGAARAQLALDDTGV